MNLDDESLLSAFLDDELDAPRRVEVEAALRSDPHLSRRLADLATARDLVAGLARPAAPAGLPAAILSRLPDRRPAPRLLRLPQFLALGAAAALAAGVFIAALVKPTAQLAQNSLPATAAPAPRAGAISSVEPAGTASDRADREAKAPGSLESAPVADLGLQKDLPAPASPPRARFSDRTEAAMSRAAGAFRGASPAADAPAPAAPELRLPSPAEPGGVVLSAEGRRLGRMEDQDVKLKAGPAEEEAVRDALTELVERPGVYRITVGVDAIDDKTLKDVRNLLDGASKVEPSWAEISVSQEIAIDPAHPGKAVVYALTLGGPERNSLEGKLKDRFGKIIVDQPDPAVAAGLARAGRRGETHFFKSFARLGPTPPQVQADGLMAKREIREQFHSPDVINYKALNADSPSANAGGFVAKDRERPGDTYGRHPEVIAGAAKKADVKGLAPPPGVPGPEPQSLAVPPPPGPSIVSQNAPQTSAAVATAGRRNGVATAPPPESTTTVLVWLTPRGPDAKAAR